MSGMKMLSQLMVSLSSADLLCSTLGKRYQDTRSPKDITAWGVTALGISRE